MQNVKYKVQNAKWRMFLSLCTLHFALCTLYSPVFAAEPFRVCDLRVDGEVGDVVAKDLDGDGLEDLIVLHTKGRRGREERWLSVFCQTAEGFPPAPQRAFRVDPRAVVFDVGDALPAPGLEIAFLARDGLYAYAVGTPPHSPSHAPRAGEGSGEEESPQKILDLPSIFQVPSPAQLPRFGFLIDLDGDGAVLVPQVDGCVLYARMRDGHLRPLGAVEMGTISRVRGFAAGRESVGFGASAGLNTPKLLTLDFNGDRRTDLLAVYPDSLCAFLRRPDGGFSGPPGQVIDLRFDRVATGSETMRDAPDDDRDERATLTKVADLNGDGVVDLMALRVSRKGGVFSAETRVEVYYGRRTGDRTTFSGSPDQVLKGGGAQVLTDVVDFNGDGRLDLFVPAVRFGLTQMIQMLITKSVDVEANIYLMGQDGRYPASPSSRRNFTVRFDFKGNQEQPVYEVADLNGDGRPDILTSEDTAELAGYYGDPARLFGRRPDLRFGVKVPRNGERVRTMQLNADRRADAVITYERQDQEEGENLRGLVRVLLSNAP